jgi:hypothetical protein
VITPCTECKHLRKDVETRTYSYNSSITRYVTYRCGVPGKVKNELQDEVWCRYWDKERPIATNFEDCNMFKTNWYYRLRNRWKIELKEVKE